MADITYDKDFFRASKYNSAKEKEKEILEQNPDAVIIIEEQGKECIIEHGKELKFVPGDVDIHEMKDELRNKVDEDFVKEYVDGELYVEGYNSNGYEYVDMGEAGIWAACNIGASKPEEPGLYFSWGETTGYLNGWNGKKFDFSDYKFGGDFGGGQTKYNSTDGLTTLEPEDDAAHVNMGGDWRIPTKDEFQKLFELCDVERTSINDRGVLKFKLKSDNNKTLIFPLGGFYTSGDVGGYNVCYCWTSSLYSENISRAYNFESNVLSSDSIFYKPRNYGLGIRGILGGNKNKSPKYLTKTQADALYQKNDRSALIWRKKDVAEIV